MLGPKDEDVQWLWDYCFEKKHDPFFRWYFSRYCREENVLAGYTGDRMDACLHLNPYKLFLRGTTLPVSYIVGLGVAPEARGGGTGELLQGALAEMRRRGHWVNILMPAYPGLYYHYQWELCYHQLHYSIPTSDLAAVAAKWGTLRLFRQPQDTEKLDNIYRRFVEGKNGYALRSLNHWTNLVDEHTLGGGYIYLLENEGQPEGYVFYELVQDGLQVREMAYTSPEAQAGLMQLLYQHRSQAKTVEWNAPLDDCLHFKLPNPKRAVSLEPFMSARIVDVAKALGAVGYPSGVEASVTLEVTDELAFWNNGLIHLTVKGGQGLVNPLAKSDAAVVHCPIGALTQLLFGRLSAAELAAMGKISTTDSRALQQLDLLFPKCNNYINEYY